MLRQRVAPRAGVPGEPRRAHDLAHQHRAQPLPRLAAAAEPAAPGRRAAGGAGEREPRRAGGARARARQRGARPLPARPGCPAAPGDRARVLRRPVARRARAAPARTARHGEDLGAPRPAKIAHLLRGATMNCRSSHELQGYARAAPAPGVRVRARHAARGRARALEALAARRSRARARGRAMGGAPYADGERGGTGNAAAAGVAGDRAAPRPQSGQDLVGLESAGPGGERRSGGAARGRGAVPAAGEHARVLHRGAVGSQDQPAGAGSDGRARRDRAAREHARPGDPRRRAQPRALGAAEGWHAQVPGRARAHRAGFPEARGRGRQVARQRAGACDQPRAARRLAHRAADRPGALYGALCKVLVMPREAATPRHRVLIVDDEESIRLLMADALSKELKVEVQLAGTCEQALRLADAGRYDAILLDLMMPGIGGFGVLLAVRRAGANATTPVIIVSTASEKDAIDRCLAAGASGYLLKPIKRAELAKALKSYLTR